MTAGGVIALALAVDAIFGEPRRIYENIPHPVVLMGRLVGRADASLNRAAGRRAKGTVVVAALCAGGAALGGALALILPWPLEAVAAATLLAQRSLSDHVSEVSRGLRISLPLGRRAAARIVGRDTGNLDHSGVSRAAIESAAENLSDGVVAPVFWFAAAGLPGIVVHKLVNTADSMIGHRTDDHREFGWAAARLDDVLNWIPARLTAGLIFLVRPAPGAARTIHRDAALHRSPNAGWPETAMAVALNVALSGPRSYGGLMESDPFANPGGRRRIGPAEIDDAVGVLWRVWAALFLLSLTAGFLF